MINVVRHCFDQIWHEVSTNCFDGQLPIPSNDAKDECADTALADFELKWEVIYLPSETTRGRCQPNVERGIFQLNILAKQGDGELGSWNKRNEVLCCLEQFQSQPPSHNDGEQQAIVYLRGFFDDVPAPGPDFSRDDRYISPITIPYRAHYCPC